MRWKLIICLSATLGIACAGVITMEERINPDFSVEETIEEKSDQVETDGAGSVNASDENNSDENDNENEDKSENDEIKVDETNETVNENSTETDTIEKETEEDIQQIEQKSSEEATVDGEDNNNSNDNGPAENPDGNGQGNGSEEDNESKDDGDEDESENSPSSSEQIAPGSAEIEVKPPDVINTESGPVKGIKLHEDLEIYSYIDIPYGSFTGYFQAPVKPQAWEKIHEVNAHQKRCPQVESDKFEGETDCLTLSIFVPTNAENAPVLFHIYDSQFTSGSADPIIYGPEHLASKGVILVLPNYRLGVLGFLCLRDEIAPGNAALKDLTLALNWTKNNIQNFGGNPDKIIVSGDGMSGALAGYLALSTKSKDNIAGVITESGSVLSPWAIDRDPAAPAAELVEILKKDITNELDLEELVISSKDVKFRPCIENGEESFLDKAPWTILSSEEIGIPFMIGSASHAGLHEATAHTEESLAVLNGDFSKFLPNDLKFETNSDRNDVAGKIREAYFGTKNISLEDMEEIALSYTDALYLGPAIRTSRLLVEKGKSNVYFYEFRFVGKMNRELEIMDIDLGATRGDIVGYVFTQDGEMPQADSDEEKMVKLVTELWVTFIQTGEPKVETDVTWKELQTAEEKEEEWLAIDSTPTMRQGLHVDRIALWTQIYEDHFVDNMATGVTSSLYVILSTALPLLGLRLVSV